MSLNLGIIASSRASAPAVSLLLDTYPGAAAAYSLRKLRTAYTGASIRVRRSSDNTETDIGFVSNQLDTATLLTFCGAGNGFVTKWYDQSGNFRDSIQTSNSNQPSIVTSGSIFYINGKPTIENTDGKYLYTTQTGFTTLQTHSDFIVLKETPSSPYKGYLTFSPTSGNDYNQTTALTITSGDFSQYTLIAALSYSLFGNVGPSNIYKLITHIINSNQGAIFTNNIAGQTGTGSFSTNNTGSLLIGTRYISGQPSLVDNVRGYLQEIITYNSNQTTNRIAIQNNINLYYSIY
jgi:hypothetical protein